MSKMFLTLICKTNSLATEVRFSLLYPCECVTVNSYLASFLSFSNAYMSRAVRLSAENVLSDVADVIGNVK